MTTLSDDQANQIRLEKATKTEGIVLTKRGRRYGTLLMAVIGLLEVVNPSNGHLWQLGSSVLKTFGF
jgi:hypothetical protein